MKLYKKISCKSLYYKEEKNEQLFEIGPLETGIGNTIANSIRRILLSTVPGYAIFQIIVEGIDHEYSNIPGIYDNLSLIILKLKNIVFKVEKNIFEFDKKPIEITLKNKKAGKIIAGDIKCPTGVTIVNKDLVITIADKKEQLNMRMFLNSGRGYISNDVNRDISSEVGSIAIDSIYCPVVQTTFKIIELINHKNLEEEKIELLIRTNGAITPSAALNASIKILINHFEFCYFGDDFKKNDHNIINSYSEKDTKNFLINQPIENLSLNQRTYNSLRRSGIITVKQILSMTKEEFFRVNNFGNKAWTDLNRELSKRNLKIKDSK